MTITGNWIIDVRGDVARITLPEVDNMERTHAGFRVLRARSREQDRYFGASHSGRSAHRNSADAVRSLYQ